MYVVYSTLLCIAFHIYIFVLSIGFVYRIAMIYMWQTQVEINIIPLRISTELPRSKRCSAELQLRVGLIRLRRLNRYSTACSTFTQNCHLWCPSCITFSRVGAHQQWSSCTWQCHKCPRRPKAKVLPRSLSWVQDYQTVEGFLGRKCSHSNDHMPQSCRSQFCWEPQLFKVC